MKTTGKVTLPELCMIKSRLEAATKAGQREMFGKICMVKGAMSMSRTGIAEALATATELTAWRAEVAWRRSWLRS